MREAPPHLQPQRAPPHPAQPICAVSGARLAGACGSSAYHHGLGESADRSHRHMVECAGSTMKAAPATVSHCALPVCTATKGVRRQGAQIHDVLYPSTCAAGLPAKYRHARTGMPYATLEAYAQIERHAGGAHAAAPAAAQQRFHGNAGPGEP